MKFGAHISASGGIQNLPKRANDIGAETFQFFSRSPRGGKAPILAKEAITTLQQECATLKIINYYIHGPYYINLASPKKTLVNNSIRVLREELERGSLIGAAGMIFHMGSARETTKEKAMQQVIEAIKTILNDYQGSCMLLIENSAGAGEIIGDTFEEIGSILKNLQNEGYTLGVCLDTQHMFASGYDLRTKKAVQHTFEEIQQHIGWKNVKVLHANDSKSDCGSHKDRHEHIGKGTIGTNGFKALLTQQEIQQMDIIIETPKKNPSDDKQNIKTLKSLITKP